MCKVSDTVGQEQMHQAAVQFAHASFDFAGMTARGFLRFAGLLVLLAVGQVFDLSSMWS